MSLDQTYRYIHRQQRQSFSFRGRCGRVRYAGFHSDAQPALLSPALPILIGATHIVSGSLYARMALSVKAMKAASDTQLSHA